MTQDKNWPEWTPEKNNVLPLVRPDEVSPGAALAAPGIPQPRTSVRKKKSAPREFKQLDSTEADTPLPEGATWGYCCNSVYHLVPVSFVAKDWKVTPRRIRFLLDAGRLQGRRQDNGYWEVFYPYRVIDGLRGPALRRHKKQERRAE